MSDNEEQTAPMGPQAANVIQIPVNLPLPSPLVMTGNLATNWKRFYRAWNNYEIAARLKDTNNPGTNKELRTATLLTCIGADALDVFDGLDFANEDDRKDIDVVVNKLEKYCIGETNETYERYCFNKRDQQSNETADGYYTALRTLAKTCNFGNLEDNLIRDRIVMGIKDNSTRKKLLQVSKLTLQQSIDICRSCEKTSKQLESMTAEGEQLFAVRREQSREQNPRRRNEKRVEEALIKCKFCNTPHPRDKFKCPAWGKVCSSCKRKNHFAVVCKAQKRSFGQRKSVSGVNGDTDSSEEEYIALLESEEEVGAVASDRYTYKPSAPLMINRNLERFQLDSGATVNVLSKSKLEGFFRKPIKKLEETNTTLVMYNGSEVKPVGKTRIQVINPKNQKKYSVEFMVVNENCKSILGAKASQLMNLLIVNKENIFTAESSIKEVPRFITKQQLIEEYPEVFQGQGILPGTLHLEIDESISPVQLPTRKIPLAVKDKLKAELDRLVEANIIFPVDTPTSWISALVVTVKKSGDIRLCIDPKPLNKALKRNHYPSPTIDDILPDLARARCFSVLDAKNGFWHVRLDESSSYATTFGTPWGRYRWLRMPFGISPAPEEFQRRVNDVLSGLPGVKVIADDILVFGSGETDEEAYQDHDKNLRRLMERCKEKGLKLNPDKIQLQLNEVSYMGHRITANGLKIDPEKTKAIRNMPIPTDKQGVQRLLGMVNFVQKFAPRLAEITTPLRNLIKKGNEFKWDEHVHGKALDEIRQTLAEPPVLRFFDPNVTPVLQCDASMNGLGACLLQDNQPVAYASRSLTPTEVQYAQIEKEMLSIVFGMERFESYLYGRKVIVESDHKPLESILKSLLSVPKRLQRMMLRLQKFELEVVYKKGPLMFMADTLSRATLEQSNTQAVREAEEVMVIHDTRSATEKELEQIDMLQNLAVRETTLVQIKQQTEADGHLQELARIIKEGWPSKQADVPSPLRVYYPFRDELTVQNGIILKGERLIVPERMRAEMKEKLHHNHGGIQATLRRARGNLLLARYEQGPGEGHCEVQYLCAVSNSKSERTSHEFADPNTSLGVNRNGFIRAPRQRLSCHSGLLL